MDKLIHKPSGELVEDNPWRVGRKVRRKNIRAYTIPAGTEGVIIERRYDTESDRVRVEWRASGLRKNPTNTSKEVLEFID